MSAPTLLQRLGEKPERIPGALLLTGPEVGRLEEEATRLAARLLCPGDDPTLSCDSCRRVFAGLHPDLLRIGPDGVQIRVDRIRDALAFGAGRPYEALRRVCVVSRAELLGLEAGNALLKSLEEPGRHLHWILATSRPEALLVTILSRCARAPVAPPSRAERLAAWRERGFSAEDAEDLSILEPAPQGAAEALAAYRNARTEVLAALEAGFLGRKLVPLLLLADRQARSDGAESRLLSELLADSAITRATSSEVLRHRAVAGVTREIGHRLPAEALRRAALLAVDAPADTRRGNRRLHYEKVLLELYLQI